MDQELKQYLDANFARMDERFAGIDEKFAGIDEKFAGIDEKFARIDESFADVDRRAEAMESRLTALVEKTETNLLGAFYGWARPMEIRVDSVTKTVMGFDERLALAERRISELERKRAS
jgi:chromosome segregation ATPase